MAFGRPANENRPRKWSPRRALAVIAGGGVAAWGLFYWAGRKLGFW